MLKRAWGLSTELQQEPELTTELTCDKRQPLNAIKVSVLNGHDTSVCKDLLGEVVDELAVDKAVEALADDVLHLGVHLLLLCLLYICHLHRHTPGHDLPFAVSNPTHTDLVMTCLADCTTQPI